MNNSKKLLISTGVMLPVALGSVLSLSLSNLNNKKATDSPSALTKYLHKHKFSYEKLEKLGGLSNNQVLKFLKQINALKAKNLNKLDLEKKLKEIKNRIDYEYNITTSAYNDFLNNSFGDPLFAGGGLL
ncbi:hypothetical protein [Mycoplasma struthionis]|uniref:Uncharacterized protein n=1 Tax=Mycoplasma struthionis TaxID=538220 RepID=A0A502M2I3_9MOLU|nr:hypothetical protein [Mycoplasma struthionis]TPI02811.1 hypothetical protein FJM01_00250 [Mycoplasma struthionis]